MEQQCIDEKLLNEICTIKTSKQYLVGQISKIYPDKFAVTLLPAIHYQDINNKQVEIRIETLNNEIYFYVALVESQHYITTNRIIFFKPISHIHENNKRQYPRLKVETYLKKVNISFQPFPPIDSTWIKGRLIDISQGGLQFKAVNYLDSGKLIEVKIGPPFFDKPELIISRIIKVNKEKDEYLTSAQFFNMNDSNKEILDNYIKKIQEKLTVMAGK